MKDEINAVIKGRGITDLDTYLDVRRTGRKTQFGDALRRQTWELKEALGRRQGAARRRGLLRRRDPCSRLRQDPHRADLPGGHHRRGAGPDARRVAAAAGSRQRAGTGPTRWALHLRRRSPAHLPGRLHTSAGRGRGPRAHRTAAHELPQHRRGLRCGVAASLATMPSRTSTRSTGVTRASPSSADRRTSRARLDLVARARGRSHHRSGQHGGRIWRSSAARRHRHLLHHELPGQVRSESAGAGRSRVAGPRTTTTAPPTTRVKVGTHHRAKGLGFKVVFLPALSDERVPTPPAPRHRRQGVRRPPRAPRGAPLFVAMTRARDRLILTCAGDPSPVLEPVIADLDCQTYWLPLGALGRIRRSGGAQRSPHFPWTSSTFENDSSATTGPFVSSFLRASTTTRISKHVETNLNDGHALARASPRAEPELRERWHRRVAGR